MLTRASATFLFALLLLVSSIASAQSATAGAESVPQIHFSGYVQYDYLAALGEEPPTPDTFRFRRARLQGTGTANPHIGWTVSIEATTTPILRDAFVSLRYLPGATVRVGQFVMPYGIEQYLFSSNTLAFTERTLTELIAFRDAGVMVANEKPFFGWLSYAAAVANGTRQNVADNNSAKDGMVRLSAAVRRVPGLQVGINTVKGEQPDGMRTRAGADVSLERRLFHVAAEFDREKTGDGPLKRGAYAFGAWRVYPRAVHSGFHHAEFGARVARTRNLTLPINQWDLSANYYVHPNLRFMCDLALRRERAPADPHATLQLRANVRF